MTEAPKPMIVNWTDLGAVQALARAFYAAAPASPMPVPPSTLLDLIVEVKALKARLTQPSCPERDRVYMSLEGLKLLVGMDKPESVRRIVDERLADARQVALNILGLE